MDRLKNMKESLMNCVQTQINGNLQSVNAKELGEAVDMIKDLSEAIYYCSITEAMEKSEKEQKLEDKVNKRLMKEKNMYSEDHKYYPPVYYSYPEYRDMDRDMGRMYYGDRRGMNTYAMNNGGNGQSTSHYRQLTLDELRDVREGRSPISRKNYMESKELHHDKAKQIKELETYMQELTQDITEMIHDASPEEKQILQQRISTLATKIK